MPQSSYFWPVSGNGKFHTRLTHIVYAGGRKSVIDLRRLYTTTFAQLCDPPVLHTAQAPIGSVTDRPNPSCLLVNVRSYYRLNFFAVIRLHPPCRRLVVQTDNIKQRPFIILGRYPHDSHHGYVLLSPMPRSSLSSLGRCLSSQSPDNLKPLSCPQLPYSYA